MLIVLYTNVYSAFGHQSVNLQWLRICLRFSFVTLAHQFSCHLIFRAMGHSKAAWIMHTYLTLNDHPSNLKWTRVAKQKMSFQKKSCSKRNMTSNLSTQCLDSPLACYICPLLLMTSSLFSSFKTCDWPCPAFSYSFIFEILFDGGEDIHMCINTYICIFMRVRPKKAGHIHR